MDGPLIVGTELGMDACGTDFCGEFNGVSIATARRAASASSLPASANGFA
jgi:hypothetical protein